MNEKRRNREKIKKLALSAAFCALAFSATWISVPAPVVGNVNLGDAILLLASWTFGGVQSVVAVAVGAMLADLTGPYAVYAPGTLLLKALMMTVSILSRSLFLRFRLSDLWARLLAGLLAETVMVLGYFAYEAFFLTLGAGALVNIPFNVIQGTVGIAVATFCYGIGKRAGIFEKGD